MHVSASPESQHSAFTKRIAMPSTVIEVVTADLESSCNMVINSCEVMEM